MKLDKEKMPIDEIIALEPILKEMEEHDKNPDNFVFFIDPNGSVSYWQKGFEPKWLKGNYEEIY